MGESRLYIIRPDAKTTELTNTELNTYSDYKTTANNPLDVKYLFLNCTEISEIEDKKVKLTRFAGRGSITIDLREIFATLVSKDIFLGNILTDTTAMFRKKCWQYAHNEWNKIGNGKSGLFLVDLTLKSDGTVDTVSSYKVYKHVYKNGQWVNFTFVWNKQLAMETTFIGNTTIRQLEMEEQL